MHLSLVTRRAATTGGLIAILVWSSTIAVTRSLSEQLGPLTAGAGVYLVGGALALGRLRTRTGFAEAWARVPSKCRWGCGPLFVGYTVLLYLAVGLAHTHEQVLEIGIVNYLWPALTVLLSIPLLQKRADAWLVPGTALALAGLFTVMTANGSHSWTMVSKYLLDAPAAYLLALIAAVFWALYSNLASRWAGPGSEGGVEWFLAATGVVLLIARFAWSEASVWSASSIAEAAFLGTVTAVAYGLWENAMRRGDMLLVAACSYFTPLLSTLVSCAYLGARLNSRLGLGCALLIAGSLISWRSVREVEGDVRQEPAKTC